MRVESLKKWVINNTSVNTKYRFKIPSFIWSSIAIVSESLFFGNFSELIVREDIKWTNFILEFLGSTALNNNIFEDLIFTWVMPFTCKYLSAEDRYSSIFWHSFHRFVEIFISYPSKRTVGSDEPILEIENIVFH
jgi:hypothetical protein